ncbi:hypothetical protein KM043_016048 [Ampulex compressa]|nr:hypothetical protein KM043_016048 [Ampulex compressa]
MRVKTVPRHIRNQNNMNLSSPQDCADADESFATDEENEKELKHSVTIVDTSRTCKSPASCASSSNRCAVAGPSNCTLSDLSYEDDFSCNDDNNNIEVMDLSKKKCKERLDEKEPCASNEPEDKFKDTILYKIMTDTTFFENIRKNKQPRTYSCPYCKLEFEDDNDLTDHMDVKKDESNQVVCCACRKTFAQKRYLRYHQRCHSERAKFTCDICNKKYTRLDNLTRHNAFHVNPDKFSCSSCEKTFARKDLLNKHQKCHDNKHRFHCKECYKYFRGAFTLDSHKRIVHSDG